ncbi:MAG: hypothetical protein C4524_01770 [Candidatus Zixiibacteriota bacterium]|nr:MAG: hypothetical protein C4524_01770 [candidate division Zixibacteria bacterium]
MLSCLLVLALGAGLAPAEVSLTVYQRDLVLVRDVRTVDLQKGENRLVFGDVAPGIYQPTLRITPLKDASAFTTLEANYDNDLASQERIWHKHLGKLFQFTKNDSLYRGILRNFDDDFIYLEPEGRPGAVALVDRGGVEDIIFEALPEGLVLRPQVTWRVKAGRAVQGLPVEISYLSNGLTWQADYTARVLGNDRLRLEGNVTLSNSLEVDFAAAHLDLIAGEVHRTADSRQLYDEEAVTAPQAAPKETGNRLFEYRHYALPGRVDVFSGQTKSLPLIGPVEVQADRHFFFDGSSGAEEVLVRLAFDNNRGAGLGMALPEGDLLLYQADDQGRLQFLGEDQLDASSAGDRVELVVGKAYDLRVDRRRVEHQRLSRNRTRDVVEIEFSSSRTEPARIIVQERLYGFWDLVETSWDGQPISPRKEDYNRAEFDVELAPGAIGTLRYVVEYGY